ncbi:MAG: RrF2 family transcriptional regulator [Clostridia bacterium]|nr:RrF2 family transcriptional regulator [Clostridia bacterium]
MMVSTRGRYALRVLLDLAQHREEDYTPMKEVAQRQELSLKYIERIMPVLVKNGYAEGVHGKGGGYRLGKEPHEIRVGDVLRLTEGELVPVSCMECTDGGCERADSCLTRPMWSRFQQIANEYFDGITLTDLLSGKTEF